MSASKLFDREKSYVLWLLGRREYSSYEVRGKLKNRGNIDQESIESLVEYVIDAGWLSDERFALSYVRQKIQAGNGPLKIRFELKQKGISSDLADVALEQQADWQQLANDIVNRKFKNFDLNDKKIKAKIYRHLGQKGFPSDIVMLSLEMLDCQ